jgi:hypothetical protein
VRRDIVESASFEAIKKNPHAVADFRAEKEMLLKKLG